MGKFFDKKPTDRHHIRLYSEQYDSPAFNALSPIDVLAYLAILRQLKGTNNGNLSLPLSFAKLHGVKHPKTLARCLRALRAVGLIDITRRGGCTKGGQRLPNLYRVTDRDSLDFPKFFLEGVKASNEWQKVTTIVQGHALINAAEKAAIEEAKLKRQGHAVTTARARGEAVKPKTRARGEVRTGNHASPSALGENDAKPLFMRATEELAADDKSTIHRARDSTPLYTAIPSADIKTNCLKVRN